MALHYSKGSAGVSLSARHYAWVGALAAEDYTVVAKVGNEVKKPVKVEDDSKCQQEATGRVCSLRIGFGSKALPAKGQVTFVLVLGSTGKEVKAKFDLKKMR